MKIVCLSSLLLVSVLNANELETYFNMSIEELLQVEVTGSTRTEQTQLDVPASVTVFTEKEISNLGVTRLAELSNYVPGFQSRRNGDASTNNSFTVRGHTSSRTVLILLDGHRINSEYLGGTNSFFSIIPLDNIKRVEFIRGAGSAVYGSNAVTGVINLISNKDKKFFSVRSSEDAHQASAQLSLNEEDFSFSAFVKGVNDNGQKYTDVTDTLNNGKTETSDPYESLDIQIRAAYKEFSLTFLHHERELDDFYLVRGLSYDEGRESEYNNLRLNYEALVTQNYKTSFSIAYLEAEDKLYGEVSPILVPDALRAKVDITEKTPGLEWFNEYTLNSKHNFVFGAEYRHPTVEGTIQYNYGIIPIIVGAPLSGYPYNPNYFTYPLIDEVSRDVYGLYGQYQGEVLKDTLLTLGLRYDEYSDFGSSVNPRLALVYKALEHTSFKLIYSEAYRAPSMNELYSANNTLVRGNSDLQAETVKSYEVIIVQQYENHAFNISYYENHMSDIIVFDNVTYANSGSAVYKGVDFEYIGEPLDNLTLRATYSYLFEKPDTAYKSSEQISSAILNYRYSQFNMSLSAYFHDRVQRSVTGEGGEIPSYFLVNTKISYPVLKNTSLYFQMNNIFDKEYDTPATGGLVSLEVPNRGRESFLGLDISF